MQKIKTALWLWGAPSIGCQMERTIGQWLFAGCKHDEEEDQILIDTCRCKSDEDEGRILYLILRNYLVCVVTLLQWLLVVLTTAMG